MKKPLLYRHDLDALRAVMMLLGVFLHAALSFMVNPIDDLWPFKFEQTHLIFDMTVLVIHLFRIPVFYIVAGYFMAFQLSRYASTREVVIKRIKRIVVPFVFGLLVLSPIVTFGFYLLMIKTYGVSWSDVSNYWSYYDLNTVHFWFLYYLIFFYIIHVGIRFIRIKLNLNATLNLTYLIRLFALVQLCILLIFGNDSIHGSYALLPPLASVVYFLMFYGLGVFAYNYQDEFDQLTSLSRNNILFSIVSTLLYIGFIGSKDNLGAILYYEVFESVLTIITVYLTVRLVFGLFSYFFSEKNVLMYRIAQSSYTLYIVHLPILIWLLYYGRVWIEDPFVFYVFLVFFTSLVSYVIYSLWERLSGQ